MKYILADFEAKLNLKALTNWLQVKSSNRKVLLSMLPRAVFMIRSQFFKVKVTSFAINKCEFI